MLAVGTNLETNLFFVWLVYLQSRAGYLAGALVSVWGSALRGGVAQVLGEFCASIGKVFFWGGTGHRALGYNFMKFRDFLDFF